MTLPLERNGAAKPHNDRRTAHVDCPRRISDARCSSRGREVNHRRIGTLGARSAGVNQMTLATHISIFQQRIQCLQISTSGGPRRCPARSGANRMASLASFAAFQSSRRKDRCRPPGPLVPSGRASTLSNSQTSQAAPAPVDLHRDTGDRAMWRPSSTCYSISAAFRLPRHLA